MNGSFGRGLAIVLALVAIALIAVAFVTGRGQITTLQETIAEQQEQLKQASQDLEAEKVRQEEFYYAFNGDLEGGLVTKLVATDDVEQRQALVSQIQGALSGKLVKYPDGQEIMAKIEEIAATEGQSAREAELDPLYDLVFSKVEPPDHALKIDGPKPETVLAAIPVLVAAVGAAGSGLMSLTLFLQGGTRRELEDKMFELELETKRIEVAQLRHAARDALSDDINLSGPRS